MNILNPIAQQFLSIAGAPWWADISLPGTLTKAYKDTVHAFDFMIAVTNGTPLLMWGNGKIGGGGSEWLFFISGKVYENDNEWFSLTTSFTTPGDWTTTSIEIYFKLYAAEFYPCKISLKEFKIRPQLPSKLQYLPFVGVG